MNFLENNNEKDRGTNINHILANQSFTTLKSLHVEQMSPLPFCNKCILFRKIFKALPERPTANPTTRGAHGNLEPDASYFLAD